MQGAADSRHLHLCGAHMHHRPRHASQATTLRRVSPSAPTNVSRRFCSHSHNIQHPLCSLHVSCHTRHLNGHPGCSASVTAACLVIAPVTTFSVCYPHRARSRIHVPTASSIVTAYTTSSCICSPPLGCLPCGINACFVSCEGSTNGNDAEMPQGRRPCSGERTCPRL
jgi:hypothetical protein